MYFNALFSPFQVMSQAEGQQKNLVQSIDSLPTRGPLSCLDQDLLLLKATSAATLSCLGECLNILQQTQSRSQAPPQSQAPERNHAAPSGESAPGPVPVLLLEPPTPPSPPSFLSFQSPSPEPCKSGKAQLGQLDCGSCPCLMATMNFNVCSKCCWMLHFVSDCLFHFVPFLFFLFVFECRPLLFSIHYCLFNVVQLHWNATSSFRWYSAKYKLECEVCMNLSTLFTKHCWLFPQRACQKKENQGLCVNEWTQI